MDESGNTREDLRLPEGDTGTDIQTRFDAGEELLISVLAAMGHEQIMTHKAKA
jgi:translation initiation factor 5A